MFVLEAAVVATNGTPVELPLAKMICISLAETFEVIGEQNKCTLNYL